MSYTKDTFKFQKPKRKVRAVFCHCSASDNPKHDNIATMKDWHVNGNGWSDIGYHLYIRKDGTIEKGRSLEKTPAAQSGYNTDTIAICCGGLESFTQAQFESLYAVCDQINNSYGKTMPFYGHNLVAAKACPVYDWKEVLGLDKGYKMTGSIIDTAVPSPTIPQPPKPEEKSFPYWENSLFRGHKQDMPIIGNGDRGYSVILLQFLIFDVDEIEKQVDGIFGPTTEKKVKKLQDVFGLTPDGIVGKDTWAAALHQRAVMAGVINYHMKDEIKGVLGKFNPDDIGDPEQQ